MFIQNGGDLCAHWAGGASTYRFCLCLSTIRIFRATTGSNEATKRTHTTPKQPARANASGLCVGACVWLAEFRATTKRGYGSASVAVRAEKKAIKSDKLIVLFSETETAKQNQKFPFHSLGRFAAEGWGEEPEKMQGNFLGCTRESASASEAHSAQSGRTMQYKATTRSARAISSSHQDSARNTFELCPIHTARIKPPFRAALLLTCSAWFH